MMEHRTTDPYEQQLLTVFDSYDYDNIGSLDRDGLTQLCQTLQLEERGNELIKCLLSEHNRATFSEFRDALLTLLGNIQNSTENDMSPEREVSPKFVYGSKKYGRRSRPRADEISPVKERGEAKYANKNLNGATVQRSNSQCEGMYTKKRKTSGNLKRCTSFPGSRYPDDTTNENSFVTSNGINTTQEFVCTESMLREAWRKLGVGEDGALNQRELILVCDAIGLRELADGVLRQLSDRLIDYEQKISFQELLEVLQRDEAWVDVLNPTAQNCESELNLTVTDSVFLNSKSMQYVTLGPRGNGYISTDTVVEMWEAAGVTSPKLLLSDLGFTSNDIDIVELASALEKEIKGTNETRSDFGNPHVALLQAILALYQSEIRCLKMIMEQMQAEREKLRCDVTEANNRASLLAQEVDDNHAKMERNTQKQVKLLEQRHADLLRDITEQYSTEKDQLSALNKSLEGRINNLESEESKLRSDLDLAHKFIVSVEKENQGLSSKVSELQQVQKVLSEQVKVLEAEKQKCHEAEQVQIDSLLSKLSALQLENVKLRDRADEMQSEIESLSGENVALRLKISSTSLNSFNPEDVMEEPVSVVCEAFGHGSKRRSDESPSKDLNLLGIGDGSPRLGKVRKFHKNKDVLDLPFTSSESGFETELDCIDSSLSNSIGENEEIVRLQARIESLEQILVENSIPIPRTLSPQPELRITKTVHLTRRCAVLEKMLIEVRADLNKIYLNEPQREDLKCVNEKLERLSVIDEPFDSMMENENDDKTKLTDAAKLTDGTDANYEEKLKKCTEENETLKAECEEMRNCLELLENEYEKCEKYWASTLEDERKVFEQEQNQYSEHLGELMRKISEYEEDFVQKNSRLPPIEERSKLEDQFTDLENEFEEYKEQAEFLMEEKDREIQDLKEQLDELVSKPKDNANVCVQTDTSINIDKKLTNLTTQIVETTNLFPEKTVPISFVTSSESILESSNKETEMTRDYVNPVLLWRKESQLIKEKKAELSVKMSDVPLEPLSAPTSLPIEMSIPPCEVEDEKQSVSMFELQSSSKEVTTNDPLKNSTPLRPKRTRKHDRMAANQRLYRRCQQNSEDDGKQCSRKWKDFNDLRCSSSNEETVVVPTKLIHNLNARLHHLELRCRQLQFGLKQQHYHDEQVLQYYWQQFRSDKAELQFLLKNAQDKFDRQVRLCNEQLDKLARADMLVKDLYVENAFLVANVQRLEQRCHMMTQCNANNSEVETVPDSSEWTNFVERIDNELNDNSKD